MLEMQMLKIIQELKSIAPHTVNARRDGRDQQIIKTHVQFEDLAKAMEEFEIVLRRPPFLEEKQAAHPQGSSSGQKQPELK